MPLSSVALPSPTVAPFRWFFSVSARPETPDWELAFVHVIHAAAARAAGAAAQHASSYTQAKAAIDAIVDAEDRDIVMRIFRHVPAA